MAGSILHAAADNLPALRRIAVVLFEGNPDVRAEGYFAITSNTVQFGARLEVSFGFSAFNVYGFLGYDVLIHPVPFAFVADIAGMIAVRTGSHVLFSISLQLTLEGHSRFTPRARRRSRSDSSSRSRSTSIS